MIWNKTRAALGRGEYLIGQFWQPGATEVSDGVLRWSQEEGVVIDLVEGGPPWPGLGADHKFVVHGSTADGDKLSVLEAWVSRRSAIDRPLRLAGTTLALGEHFDLDRKWPRVIYSTAALSEWIADSGLSWPRVKKGVTLRWDPPPRHEFRLPGARVAIAGRADPDPIGYRPDWSITTSQTLVVNPTRQMRMNDLFSQFAEPLLALMAFAADRPESMIRELLVDKPAGQQAEIWRRGRSVAPREWRPRDGYLFWGYDLSDLPLGVRRWWRLHRRVWPALGLFGEHIQQGDTYSPARFLTLYTALEVYGRERHGQHNLRRLRDYAGVSEEVHGCSNPALALIGQTRKYLAHLRHDGAFSDDEISDSVFESTRRAAALLQACLLRELGFGKRRTTALMNEHYSNWQIPLIDKDHK